jgi:hypothetical protein
MIVGNDINKAAEYGSRDPENRIDVGCLDPDPSRYNPLVCRDAEPPDSAPDTGWTGA